MCIAAEVLELFSEGDINAMNTVVEAYKSELYNFCFRLTWSSHDAEDLFQQTWIKAVKNSGSFKSGSLRPWLYKICVNQYRDNCREIMKRKKHMAEEFPSTSAKDYVLSEYGIDASAEEQYEKKHIQALLVANIDKLPIKQKVPVVLFFYQRMKYSEIADALFIPEGTVKSRINTAKRRLKTALERELYV